MEAIEKKLSELAEALGGKLSGNGDAVIKGVNSLEAAGPDEISFLANSRYESQMGNSQAAAVLVAEDYAGPQPEKAALIRCKDPYFGFRQAMVMYYGFREPGFDGIDPRANIDPSATIADGIRVGSFATISAGATVGADTVIYPGVFVGPDCRIGAGCIIYPNVVIYDGCILGDRVTIHANSSIGHDGFGYATHEGAHHKIPQAGWVELHDDVEIGACCTIDRATMGATIVGFGTKFSNLVAIGHGTKLGKHCLLVGQAGLAGSVIAGDYCVFAGQSGVVGHIRIGNGCKIAAKAGLVGDLKDGQEAWGSPTVGGGNGRRVLATMPHLPQMRSAIRKLTREINTLKKRMGLTSPDSKE